MRPRNHSCALAVLAVMAAITTGAVLSTLGSGRSLVEPTAPGATQEVYSDRRHEMVRSLRAGPELQSPVVRQAMETVPRHLFVPESVRHLAYEDRPLPIGSDQTISAPSVVAVMTELLELTQDSRVLEVGTGSGYQAAVLAEVVGHVYTIEILPELADGASRTLAELGYANVSVRCGDGYQGWPSEAPFDGIIVTCAPESIPAPLTDQLAEGGRMVLPVGPERGLQWLHVLVKENGQVTDSRSLPVTFVPMTGEAEENDARTGRSR